MTYEEEELQKKLAEELFGGDWNKDLDDMFDEANSFAKDNNLKVYQHDCYAFLSLYISDMPKDELIKFWESLCERESIMRRAMKEVF